MTVVSPKKGKKKATTTTVAAPVQQQQQQQPTAVVAPQPAAPAKQQQQQPVAQKAVQQQPAAAKTAAAEPTPLIIVSSQSQAMASAPRTVPVPVIKIQGKFDINSVTSSIIDSVLSGNATETTNIIIGSKAAPVTAEQVLATGEHEDDEWTKAKDTKPKKVIT